MRQGDRLGGRSSVCPWELFTAVGVCTGMKLFIRIPAAIVCTLFLLPAALAQDAPASGWAEFIAWYRATPGITDPNKVFAAYAAKLKADGVADPAIKERISAILKEVPRHTAEVMSIHFDNIYAEPKPPFRSEATAYLARAIEGRSPGAALDVGMGQGRNALHLASKGWQVTGYDVSEGGLALARKAADAHKLQINAVRASHDDFDFGTERWDLIVMTYSFAPMEDARFLQRLRDSLKPGGIVVVEQFNAAPGNPAGKGPANALIKSFEGLRVIHYEDLVGPSDWGGDAPSRIGRITAQKDGPADKSVRD